MGFKITSEEKLIESAALIDLKPGLYACTTTGSNDIFALVKGKITFNKKTQEYDNVILFDSEAQIENAYFAPGTAWKNDLFLPVQSIRIKFSN